MVIWSTLVIVTQGPQTPGNQTPPFNLHVLPGNNKKNTQQKGTSDAVAGKLGKSCSDLQTYPKSFLKSLFQHSRCLTNIQLLQGTLLRASFVMAKQVSWLHFCSYLLIYYKYSSYQSHNKSVIFYISEEIRFIHQTPVNTFQNTFNTIKRSRRNLEQQKN